MLKNNSSEINTVEPLFNIWNLLDWIFPPFCVNCHQIGYEICPDCFAGIALLEHRKTCEHCGKIITKGLICHECEHDPPAFDQLRSWAEYQGAMQKIITRIKYQRGIGLIPYLVEPLSKIINARNWPVDMIVPVPLGKKRLRERGYNQAEWIAKPIARALKVPFISRALRRIKETRSQVGLHAAERGQNMAGAFQADQTLCQDKNILLIDDIATTGATLNECARALKLVGAKKIYCFTVARTNLYQNSIEKSMEVRL